MAAFLTWCVASASLTPPGTSIWAAGIGSMALIAGMVLFLRFGSHRFARVSEGVAWIAVIGFPVWLAWDRVATPFEPLVAPPPAVAAEAARSTYLAGCKGGACDSWADLELPNLTQASIWMRSAPDEYANFLAHRGDDIEAAWIAIANGRAWVDEMNSFPTISDFVTDYGAPVLYFKAIRNLTQITVHRAALQASQGDGDEALRTLQPLVQLSGKLRRDSRAIVTFMIANVVESQLIMTTDFVLQHGTPSGAARSALAQSFDDGVWDARDLARCIETDAAIGMEAVRNNTVKLSAIVPLLFGIGQPLVPLLFNRQHYEAEASNYIHQATDLAVNRDLEGLRKLHDGLKNGSRQIHVKNAAGRLLLNMMLPAVSKLAERHWRTIDGRRAVVDQLRDLPISVASREA